MLTKISAITAFLALVINFVVIMGWWSATADQITALNLVIVGAGTVIHSLFNPAVPVGVTE
jgi:hypothetical protein